MVKKSSHSSAQTSVYILHKCSPRTAPSQVLPGAWVSCFCKPSTGFTLSSLRCPCRFLPSASVRASSPPPGTGSVPSMDPITQGGVRGCWARPPSLAPEGSSPARTHTSKGRSPPQLQSPKHTSHAGTSLPWPAPVNLVFLVFLFHLLSSYFGDWLLIISLFPSS